MPWFRSRPVPRRTYAPALMCALVLLGLSTGCPGPAKPVWEPGTLRDIRVRLAVSRSDVRIQVPGRHTIRDSNGVIVLRGAALTWATVSAGHGVVLGDRALGEDRIEIVPEPGVVIAVSRRTESGWETPRSYGGHLRLLVRADGSVDIINVVNIETYVAGVLPGEIYQSFHKEAFRAQAIATRTYALYQMSTCSGGDYDVTATEGSQVYQGMSDTEAYRKACKAVGHTRGVVCTWTSPHGERIFCTYFSSACGGMTQSVPHGGSRHRIPPLAGGVRCDYCRIAKGEAYRWKPRSIPTAELMSRLSERYQLAAKLGRLRDAHVLRRTTSGHIRRIELIGETGETLVLPGENFRLAVGSRIMRSANCRVRVEGTSMVFEDGKGFGHGMGLCQWGMEGQARRGRSATEILRFYYPQSHLRRAY